MTKNFIIIEAINKFGEELVIYFILYSDGYCIMKFSYANIMENAVLKAYVYREKNY